MSTAITLIPGDGIGPSITEATVRVLEAGGAALELDRRLAGMAAVHEMDDPLPQATLDSAERTGVILKGPLTTPVGRGFRSINVELRKTFDLYANVRPARTLMPGGRYEDIDLVLIRENTEGLYVGVEHYIGLEGDPKAAAESVMIITRFGAERIVRYAFEYAVAHGRRKVTLAHKANILKYTQGLFLEVGHDVAEEYAGWVEFEDMIIDACAMNMVLDPYQFDVLVMENMFGDILSDLMAGLVGGLGMTPGGNIGEGAAMFEPVHGSAPDIVGAGVANPTAQILAACMMLDHIGQPEPAARIRAAIEGCLRSGDPGQRTRDIGGEAGTDAFADALVRRLE